MAGGLEPDARVLTRQGRCAWMPAGALSIIRSWVAFGSRISERRAHRAASLIPVKRIRALEAQNRFQPCPWWTRCGLLATRDR